MRPASVVAFSLLANAGFAFAGPLDPPGAPAPTYRTLDQISPGTPLSEVSGDANSVHSIKSGGRYYFDRDIESPGSGMYAIEINTVEAVEIDFGGFSIRGNGSETLAAIDLNSGIATVHGGVIANWAVEAMTETDSTLTLRHMTMRAIGGATLLNVNRRTLIEGCVFESNAGPINLNGGGVGGTQSGIVIRNCTFAGMPSAIDGPSTSGVQILDCSFAGLNGPSEEARVVVGSDAVVSRCSFVRGGDTAVIAGNGLRMSDCVVNGQLTTAAIPGVVASFNASVINCTVNGFSGDGIRVGDHAVIRDCVVSASGGIGINAAAAAVITGNSLRANATGIDATFGSRVVGNSLRSNSAGIVVGDDSYVGENTLDSDDVIVNGSDNVIDGNTFTDINSGVELNAQGNTVRRNTFSSTTITGTQGLTGNRVFTIRTSADFQSSGPFDNLQF